ncbi:MAG: DUF2071 domain-containing protein [Actinobacteria bacterium]|nr:DUF2071 domain-containing protein [Actinomycetota bacterium]NIS36124.1 DUF2071 domain-containing protein [Actinomycetota bacterium]NIU22171.1 DUF2071 domain-containing protein [Actinomycetota bacterium]NIU70698.1 DUF2071 domain-containing protein [Actinomycetota bacterium]NIW32603.1 DUF2071 domain-containing protein [Actinomycetota bacterium]
MRIRRPVMHMGWQELAYVHWPYAPDAVNRLLPDGLRADVSEGSAWVGLIPFTMDRIRFPFLPVVPYVSSFPETNVRTYVVDRSGRRGIWFFSLDVNRLLPALVARTTYRLPYCWGPMTVERRGDRIRYEGRRRWPRPRGVGSVVEIEVGERIPDQDVTDREHFLTAAWGLYSSFARRLIWAPVDHPRWPLHRAELVELRQDLVEAAGLPTPAGEPLVHWSPGVRVRVARPRPA